MEVKMDNTIYTMACFKTIVLFEEANSRKLN